jgi:hypothetical protein
MVGGAGVRNVNVEAGMGSIADDGVRWDGYILLLLLVMVMEELLRVVEGVGGGIWASKEIKQAG